MARIPLDPSRTLVCRLAQSYSRRSFGDVADPPAAMGHTPRILLTDARLDTVRGEQHAALRLVLVDGPVEQVLSVADRPGRADRAHAPLTWPSSGLRRVLLGSAA